ncbi:MAG: helix-turn-helix transcriptional regulator [Candidatus Limiplasma sp.]|nr:helix-turn-helix transcriptional regulator [Candidatus Limiplasma sp.]
MLGEKIAEYRTNANMTQQSLADALGVSKNTIFSWEKGIRNPSLDMLQKIATYFATTVDNLLGYSEPAIPKDDEIKFALFGVDPANITDAQFEEVKRFAQFIREQKSKQNKE